VRTPYRIGSGTEIIHSFLTADTTSSGNSRDAISDALRYQLFMPEDEHRRRD
jgi:hypothetical protein